MEKQTHSTFNLVPSEFTNIYGFKSFLWKKGVTNASFVVPIFQGGDSCYIDGKTCTFHFRPVFPSETSKRLKITYFTIKFWSLTPKISPFSVKCRFFSLRHRPTTQKIRHFNISIRLFTAKPGPFTLKLRTFTLNIRLLMVKN